LPVVGSLLKSHGCEESLAYRNVWLQLLSPVSLTWHCFEKSTRTAFVSIAREIRPIICQHCHPFSDVLSDLSRSHTKPASVWGHTWCSSQRRNCPALLASFLLGLFKIKYFAFTQVPKKANCLSRPYLRQTFICTYKNSSRRAKGGESRFVSYDEKKERSRLMGARAIEPLHTTQFSLQIFFDAIAHPPFIFQFSSSTRVVLHTQ
jgi:hypothetical protein